MFSTKMRPILLPFLEARVRSALERSGVRTAMVKTPLGHVHLYDAPGTGSLPPIVLLHGLSAAATPFAPVLARLRKQSKRVIAPDYPGHGFSDAPDSQLTVARLFETMTAVIDDLFKADERIVLVGNSLGGAVAIDYAVKRPEKVHAAALFSPAGAASSDAEFEALRKAFAVRSRRDALAFVNRIYHRVPPLARVIAHEIPANMNRRAILDLFETTSSSDVIPPEDVSALTMPILLSWGRSERLLPPAHLAWWKQHLPKHAIIEEPEGEGHCPHFDAPQAMTDRIVTLVKARPT